jgi:uncharacterized integral membrane protein
MKYLKTLLWMAAFFLAIHFSMQNRDGVTLRYSFQGYPCFEVSQVPLFLVILCSIFLGVVIGGLGDFFRRFQLKRTLRQSQQAIDRLEKEVQALKGLGSSSSFLLKKEE